MKNLFALTTIMMLAIFSVGVSATLFWQWLGIQDAAITQAKQLYPLGDRQTYIIVKTDLMLGGKPFLYAIRKPEEATDAAALAWRRVGMSKVNLEQYIDREVTIEGTYYIGKPLIIGNIPAEIYRDIMVDQPVIRIDNLTPVK